MIKKLIKQFIKQLNKQFMRTGILFFSGLLNSHLAFSAENFIDFIRTPINEKQKEIIIQALENGAQTKAMVQYIDGIYHVPFSKDIFEITLYGDNNEIVYISSDGKYIFQADIIYTPDAVSITRIRREDLAELKGLNNNYPPPVVIIKNNANDIDENIDGNGENNEEDDFSSQEALLISTNEEDDDDLMQSDDADEENHPQDDETDKINAGDEDDEINAANKINVVNDANKNNKDDNSFLLDFPESIYSPEIPLLDETLPPEE